MAMAMMIGRSIRPMLSRHFLPRNLHLEGQVSYTPKALQAIMNSRKVAMEHNQRFIEAESLMISPLKQEAGLVPKVLKDMELDPWLIKLSVVNFLKNQPQRTESKFTDTWLWLARLLKVFGAKNLVSHMYGVHAYYKIKPPKSHLNGILQEAMNQMKNMCEKVVIEAHLLMAYFHDPRLGKFMLADLRVTDRFVWYVAKQVSKSIYI